MDANPPDTATFAHAASQANAVSIQDFAVLVGWLAERIAQLEALVQPDERIPMPLLPSRIRENFGIIPKREAMVAEAMRKLANSR